MANHWDYIIVGAGTAGCVLAHRLSSQSNAKVLLLEAGGKRLNPWLHIPVGYFKTVGNPHFDWCYSTERENNLRQRPIFWPRGKVIGGSGSINGLVYVRGQPEDYNQWRDAGCTGWGWDDLLAYFIKSENQQRGGNSYHGTRGPVAVSDNRADFDICNRFITAAQAAGLPFNEDCNDGKQYGVGYYQTTTKAGVRSSTASGHLKQAKHNADLTVKPNTQVIRILFQKTTAKGVEYIDNRGQRQIAYAETEVILSAGAIGSPHLLMLSGIGDSAHLQQHNIDAVEHIPAVGQNLHDHLKIHNSYRTDIATLNDQLNSPIGKMTMGLDYLMRRRGPLTMGAAPVFGFTHTPYAHERPDIQFHVLPWSSDTPATGVMHPFSGFTVSICPLRPESRGAIKLHSNNPLLAPKISANYLHTEMDRKVAIEGIRSAREICEQPGLKEVIREEIRPGIESQTDQEMLNYIQQNASTIFHPVGTCRMGSDDAAVVDPQLRLNGIANLRVIDASIMPSITSGNTNAPTIAIAEKATDLILAKYSSKVEVSI